MKIAGRNQALPHLSVTEAIQFMQQADYDAIELSLLRGNNTVLTELTEPFMIRHVLECIRKKPSFEISAVSCHANYVTDDFIFSVQQRLLRVAREYGTNIVIMSTYVPYSIRERQEKELWDKLIQRTRQLCDIAEQEGVYIALEPEPNSIVRNQDYFLRMAGQVRSPALKMNFDIGHAFLCEPDLFQAIGDVSSYIVHGHIENMCRGEHCHKLPWEGDIDLAAACRALYENGFNGTLALDLYLQDYTAVSSDCVSYIKHNIYGSQANNRRM